MVQGIIPAAKISDDATTSLLAVARRRRIGHIAQSPSAGTIETTPGLTIAPKAESAPQPIHEFSRRERRTSNVAATMSANISAESAVSHTQTVEKKSDVGNTTQVHAAALPMRLPNALAPM